MEEYKYKIIASLFMLFFVASGVYAIKYPKHAYRSSALNARKKNPNKSTLKFVVIQGYLLLALGIAMIIIIFSGGIRGL